MHITISIVIMQVAVSVGTMQLTLSIAIMQVPRSNAMVQILIFYCNHVGSTFCNTYVMLVDLFLQS